jgi:hypothetical protein
VRSPRVGSFAVALGLIVAGTAPLAGASIAGSLSTMASAASPTTIRVAWSWWEDPANPTGHPEWVGYDVWRRASAACGEWVRVNPDIVARTPGVTQDASYLDATAAPATTYEYRVRLVDASRTPLMFPPPDCLWPCNPPAFAMCPDYSAPLVVGTVSEWGWAVLVTGCSSGCWGAFYVENPAADALRPLAGTGLAVAIYGGTQCGTVEGCALTLDHFESAGCGPTPARRASWGALKSHYR